MCRGCRDRGAGGSRPPRLKKVNELAGARNAPRPLVRLANRSAQALVGFSMRPAQSYGDKAGDQEAAPQRRRSCFAVHVAALP
jgi:hypothetical protein